MRPLSVFFLLPQNHLNALRHHALADEKNPSKTAFVETLLRSGRHSRIEMAANWNNLRPWKNSQNNAFEELCCQLAEYEPQPQGSLFVRKGTPDGGVECFWKLPTGRERAWQAKYMQPPFGPAQWKQVDESVHNAIEKHGNLSRYTICFPFDRPDARTKGTTSFLALWDRKVKEWETWASKRGRSVEFDYWGDHEICERLSRLEHAGRRKFWFDTEFLSQSWFANHIREVEANAGNRYTAILNVDLPIARTFDGLGRTPELFAKVDEFHKKIRHAYRYVGFTKANELAPAQASELQRRMPDLFEALSEMRDHGWRVLPFNDLAAIQIKSTQQLIELLRQHQEKSRPKSQPAERERSLSSDEDLKGVIFRLYELLRYLNELSEFSSSSCALMSNNPALLVVGPAGSGKTHLLCDVAVKRIRSGYPTVVLLGEQFGDAEPWRRILDLLKLDCAREELLGALDAAAQAAGTRALIQIDALNEGDGYRIWNKHLAGILAHLENYPRIGIAVTVRSSYEKLIVPQQLISSHKIVREEHRGFEEHEYEAANRFFTHFGIEPSVPLLYPEFKNPQFPQGSPKTGQ